MISIKKIIEKYGAELHLKLVCGENGLHRKITVPEVQRPGLSLSGYLRGYTQKRLLIFGRAEIRYLKSLPPEVRESRLKNILSKKTPAVIVTRNLAPPKELKEICLIAQIPLFQVPLKTMELSNKLVAVLSEAFSPETSCHGTLVEVFGIGVLIQGDSSVGKSEAALGLIERGHRLISDDVVKIKKKEGNYLEGKGPELTRHLLEIRGLGIINVAHLYGAVSISERYRIDLSIKLEEWDDTHFYDRVGLEEQYKDFLGIKIPFQILPLKPGRDVVLLIETLVLNMRLKKMGYHSAKEFNLKLLEAIASRKSNSRITFGINKKNS